ncbi:MAG: hypothetical protein BAA01_09825 [Bacillus thermozeamaize]|uniref:HTH-type transcriptional regulatory protein TyrR n=1 Tax=Bacillus thermozeamaize TaxID=230954 RepID=A0A1Y3PK02_9BACI|nr:MAG: hypothetical protein BAA01_09825 [Bacillus thermozeamaize]
MIPKVQNDVACLLNPEAQMILNSSFDGIMISDGNGVVQWANEASARICGLPLEELVGKTTEELEKAEVFRPSITLMVLKNKKPVTYFQNTKSGRKVLVTGSPIFDESGKIRWVICNSRDITELLNLRAQLELAEKKAKRFQSELEALKIRSDITMDFVMESDHIKRLVSMVLRIAPKDVTVLILGESGVGKNALAAMIHNASNRNLGPFIEINCGAIPESLFESELFGYEPGAFTGAQRQGKKGQIELANGGTLFLNEVGELPLSMQAKLLTFLQEGYFYRVGGTKPVRADVRVIAATNRDLAEMVTRGEFRADLYYRLNVVSLTISPLRERPEDILVLAEYFLDQFNRKHGTNKKYAPETLHLMLNYSWPGNARELRNAIERAVVISESEWILPSDLQVDTERLQPAVSLKQALEQFEKDLLTRAFKIYGSTHKVAQALKISQPTIVRKSKKYRIRVVN